jgi:hypothetical protein
VPLCLYEKAQAKTVPFCPTAACRLGISAIQVQYSWYFRGTFTYIKAAGAKVSGSNSRAFKRKGCRYASTKKYRQKQSHFVPILHADLAFRQYWCTTHGILGDAFTYIKVAGAEVSGSNSRAFNRKGCRYASTLYAKRYRLPPQNGNLGSFSR